MQDVPSMLRVRPMPALRSIYFASQSLVAKKIEFTLHKKFPRRDFLPLTPATTWFRPSGFPNATPEHRRPRSRAR